LRQCVAHFRVHRIGEAVEAVGAIEGQARDTRVAAEKNGLVAIVASTVIPRAESIVTASIHLDPASRDDNKCRSHVSSRTPIIRASDADHAKRLATKAESVSVAFAAGLAPVPW
jgi:hypothetical protein